MTVVMKLSFPLPDEWMAESFAFDTAYRGLLSTADFKQELLDGWLKTQTSILEEKVVSPFMKDLHHGWLKNQTSFVKVIVEDLIFDYINDGDMWMFSNEYCSVLGPSCVVEKEKREGRYYGENFLSYEDFMIYVAPPKNNVLYFKILPKSFSNKPKDFFEKICFDGYICHIDNPLKNFIEVQKWLIYGQAYWTINRENDSSIEMHISGIRRK